MNTTDVKLLIVEDHPIVREGLRKALSSRGFTEIVEAASCAEGRAQLSRCDPSILITDLHLPDGLSFEMITWARKLKPEIAIIILTIEANPNFLLAAAESGANALIHKSAPISHLISAIDAAMRALAALLPRVLLKRCGSSGSDQSSHRENWKSWRSSLPERSFRVLAMRSTLAYRP